MEIQCKNCHKTYEFSRYGDTCPYCNTENVPFRSQAARRMLGYGTDTYRGSAFNDLLAQRREAFLRSGDPDYGKSPFRRIRKYLIILAFCFGVAALGLTLGQIGRARENPGASLPQVTLPAVSDMEKPPVQELASGKVDTKFEEMEGVTIRVKYIGTVESKPLEGRRKCVFVDLHVTTQDTGAAAIPGELYLQAGDKRYVPVDPSKEGISLERYTPLRPEELAESHFAAGQVFFYLPESLQDVSLCWKNKGTEQRMPLGF